MIKSLLILMMASFSQEADIWDTLPARESFLVEVVTPAEEIYDDGACRLRYAPFTVSDSTGVLLLEVAAKYDRPAVISLPKGKFLLRTKSPEIIEKFITTGNSSSLKIIF